MTPEESSQGSYSPEASQPLFEDLFEQTLIPLDATEQAGMEPDNPGAALEAEQAAQKQRLDQITRQPQTETALPPTPSLSNLGQPNSVAQSPQRPSPGPSQGFTKSSPNFGDFFSKANKRTQDTKGAVQPNPAAKPQKDHATEAQKNLKKASQSKDPSKMAATQGKAISEQLGGEDTTLGRGVAKAASLTEDGINIARAFGGDVTAIKNLAVKYWKPIAAVLGLLFLLLALLFYFVLFRKPVEVGNFNALAAGSPGYSGSVATVDVLDGLKIPYPETAIGYEQPACDDAIQGGASARIEPFRNEKCEGGSGATYHGKTGHSTGWGKLSMAPLTPEEAQWYMNEPWPSKGAYAHKKVVITAVDSGKSVVASIGETGPAASVCAKGRCAGGSPWVLQALGWNDTNDARNKVRIAFAADQSVPLGPITLNTSTGTSTASGVTATKGVTDMTATDVHYGNPRLVPNVPGVRQATETSCNKASAAMVVMHYGASSDDVLTTNSQGYIVQDSSFCLTGQGTVNAINQKLKGKGAIFATKTSSQATITSIKASLDKGNPVIACFKPGYASSRNNQHFVVLVGYDDKTFYMNDPYRFGDGTIHIYTNRTRMRKTMTFESVAASLCSSSNSNNSYAVIMRTK